MRENLEDGKACAHPGCLHHFSHPCEGCGRIAGRAPTPIEEKILARCSTIERERDGLAARLRRATIQNRRLTCVYCGQAYPTGTPASGKDVEALTKHIEQCTAHPLFKANQKIAALEAQRDALEAALTKIAARDNGQTIPCPCQRIARAALAAAKKENGK